VIDVRKDVVINELLKFNSLKIVQNKNYFNFSLDSILLPSIVSLNKSTKKIMDLCTGNAPIPLILSTKTDAKIYGVEIQKEIYELAKETLKINSLEKKIVLINDDVKNIVNKFETDSFDIITCNPPYFKVTDQSLKNDNEIKSIARHEILINLEDIIVIARKLLKNNGQLCLVHRTDRLIDIIVLMRQNNIEPKKIRFIYPKVGKESNLVLINGTKNGKQGLKILNPLIVHDEEGNYTKEVLEMFS